MIVQAACMLQQEWCGSGL